MARTPPGARRWPAVRRPEPPGTRARDPAAIPPGTPGTPGTPAGLWGPWDPAWPAFAGRSGDPAAAAAASAARATARPRASRARPPSGPGCSTTGQAAAPAAAPPAAGRSARRPRAVPRCPAGRLRPSGAAGRSLRPRLGRRIPVRCREQGRVQRVFHSLLGQAGDFLPGHHDLEDLAVDLPVAELPGPGRVAALVGDVQPVAEIVQDQAGLAAVLAGQARLPQCVQVGDVDLLAPVAARGREAELVRRRAR